MTPSLTLDEIATLLNCPSPTGPIRSDIGEFSRVVTGIATLAEATGSELSFLGSDKYLPEFARTQAAAVIVQKRVKLPSGHGRAIFIVDDADLAVAKVLERIAPDIARPPLGVDSAARVSSSANLGQNVAIGANVVVGQRSVIGAHTILHPGVVIGDDVSVGENCEFFANVVIRERITVGKRVIINAGSVLGTDGFGYRWDGSRHQKIPQIGTVIIEDDVEIGSCVCIDRAKFSATRIGRGTKIDNLVQIGHNVVVGPHCIIVGQAALAGSVKLGAGVVLGGQCAVRDHVTIGDASMVAACSAVAEDVESKTVVSGLPALPHRQTLREQAALRRLPDLVVKMRKLQDQIDELRGNKG